MLSIKRVARNSLSASAAGLLLLVMATSTDAVYAQHQGHGGPQFGVSAAEAGIIAETSPSDDSVLASAPDRLQIAFGKPVQLVKLVLYTDDREWVDIDFRFNPRANTEFSWPVPELEQLAYYSVSWAILDERDRLVKGDFSFSFGPGAELPSAIMERKMMMEGHEGHDMRNMQPMNPSEIRINGQNPNFDPPFAPVLD